MPIPVKDHPVIAQAAKVRAAIMRRDAATLNDLTRKYAASYRSLRVDTRNFVKKLATIQPSAGDIAHLTSMRNLLDSVKTTMDRFALQLNGVMQEATREAIERAGEDSLLLVQARLPLIDVAEIRAMWGVIDPEQVYAMYGFLDPAGPLYGIVESEFGGLVAKRVRDDMLRGYITGMNPRTVAWIIRKSVGVGLNWAMGYARTAHLWAYRTATHQNYLNNSHVVEGWTWYAELDDRTCMSCIFQHGSFHSLSEILDDHHMGRCTALPETKTYRQLGYKFREERVPIQRGEVWFKGLKAADQRSLMGGATWRAWQANEIDFDQLSAVYNDRIYGIMRRQASLKKMLGDKAKRFYARAG